MIAQKQEWTTSNKNILDYIIIGSGPAGLQMGYFLQKQKQNFLILERGEKAGSFFQKFPRHGQLISSNKVYTGYNDREINLRWDWNSLLNDNDRLLFKNYSQAYFPQSQSLTTYLQDFANYYQLPIDYEVNVVKITKEDNFKIEDSRGKYYICRYLIIASGSEDKTVKIWSVKTGETRFTLQGHSDKPLPLEDSSNYCKRVS